MSLGAAELKLGYDLFSKLMGWASGRRSSKALEKLKSDAYQELLKGKSADMAKIAAALRKLRNSGDDSADTERFEMLYRGATKPACTGKSVKFAAVKAAKVPAKKARFHATTVKKSGVKKPVAWHTKK